MDCKTARQWISPYLDSELEKAKTFEICEHLRICDACRRRFDAERQVEALACDRLRQDEMPAAVWAQLRSEVNRSGNWRRLSFPAGLLATAAIIAVAAVVLPQTGWFGGKNVAVPVRWDAIVKDALPSNAVFDEAEIQQALQDRYGLALSTDLKDTAGHPVRIIGGMPVVFGNQDAYQVRVECCGRPAVITLLHMADAAALPSELKDLSGVALGHSVMRDGINIRVEKVGEVESFIASEHYLDGLVHTLRPGNI